MTRPNDRLMQETSPEGTVSYSYDADGRRTSLTVAGQPAINYSYDNTNRLTGITQGTNTVSFAYDNANRRTSLTLANGVVMSYSYDTASQLTGINYALGQNTLGNLAYTHDLAGRRTSVGGSFATVNLPNPVSQTAYDAANELTEWNAATPVYDANGNTLSDGTNSYAWNGRNQLASMNMGAESFQYDPLGRRVSKTALFGTTSYLYDVANPVQELSGTTVTANLLTGLSVDEYFQRTDSSGPANFLTDALGSTLSLTDPSGNTLASYTYEPFGNTMTTGSSANTHQYTGRENDGTGVYFYRARYYSPMFQRFISEDPIGLRGGNPNLYAYARNNPVSFRDPSGLCSDPGGPGARVCIETFIPQSSVWGFAGDDRGPSPDGGSYRTQQELWLSPDGPISEDDDTGISRFGPLRRKGVPGPCGVTRLSGRKFRATCAASDGLFFGVAPNASYDLLFQGTPYGLSVSGVGTPFPDLEVWLYQDGAGPQLLFYYSGGGNTGPSDLYNQTPLPRSSYPLPPR